MHRHQRRQGGIAGQVEQLDIVEASLTLSSTWPSRYWVHEFLGLTAKITTKTPPRPLIGKWPPSDVGLNRPWFRRLLPLTRDCPICRRNAQPCDTTQKPTQQGLY